VGHRRRPDGQDRQRGHRQHLRLRCLGALATWSNGTTQTTYGYDADSNRTSATATTIATGAVTSNQTFTYDARDELTGTTDSVTTASSSYTYTPRGTTAQVSTVSATGATAATTYQDDAFGQQTGAGAVGYAYDALGRLTNETGTSKNTTLQYSGTGNDVAGDGTDTYSRDPEGGLVAAADPAAKTSGLIWTDLHTDVVGEFTATGTALTGTETYTPLGAAIGDTGATAGLSLGYQSEYTDPGTGHVNMAARWYNPATGQFTSTDTVSNSAVPDTANANPFAYADGDSLTGTDPTGHWLKFSDDDASGLVDAAELRAMSSAAYGSTAYWNRFHDIIKYDIRTDIPILQQEEAEFDHYYTPVPFKWYDPDCVDGGGHNACGDGPPVPGQMFRASLAQYVANDDANDAMEHYLDNQTTDQVISFGVGGVAGLVCSALGGPFAAFAGGACAGAASSLTQKGLECAQGYDTNCFFGAFLKTAMGGAATGVAMTAITMVGSYAASRLLDGFGSLLESDIPSDEVVDEGTAEAAAESGVADYMTTHVSAVNDTINSTIDDLEGALADGPPAEVPPATTSKPSSSSDGSSTNTAPPAEAVQAKLAGDATGPMTPENAPPALEATPPKVNAPAAPAESDAAANTESTAANTSSGPGCTHSFTGDTPVLMAGGSTRPVDQIKVGETVENSAPGKSGTQAHKVDAVIVTTTDHDFVEVTVNAAAPKPSPAPKPAKPKAPTAASAPAGQSGGTITTTFHHPFYDPTQGAFVQAQYLKPGDDLQTPTGAAQITAVHLFHADTTTYDLTIDGLHTFYVVAGNTPVLVHNNDDETCPMGSRTDFIHATSLESANNIINNGLDSSENIRSMTANSTGSKAPGSFFTAKVVDPGDIDTPIDAAFGWRPKSECFIVCRLPDSLVSQLENAGQLKHTVLPFQSVFSPDAFPAINEAMENGSGEWVGPVIPANRR
jgi:RHS repeat-associated protein